MTMLLSSHNEWLKNAALPLQIVGILSAIIFALNFSFEILLFQDLERNHQFILLTLLIVLAIWAIIESKFLKQHQHQIPLRHLSITLFAQLIVECLRLVVLIMGPKAGIDRNYGINVLNVGPLFIWLVVYVLIFLFIAKTLIAGYLAEIEFINQSLENSNQELKKMSVLQAEQSRREEREQLLQDMHDGFGSQLASVRILAEQGRIKNEQFPDYLREMTSDLHLIVDTLSQEDITLLSALTDMQYRLQRRFNSEALRLHWNIRLDDCPELNTRLILHVLRIMQEAFNNAIRHANPKNIWFSAVIDIVHQTIEICVRDDGSGMPEVIQPGRGLSNMKQRTREIGGKLEQIDHHPGTEIKVTLKITPLAENSVPVTT